MSYDATSMGLLCLTFVFAGTVKGVIGLGLPTISLALLTLAFDLPTAMALLLVPSFFTNLWQALVGGFFNILLRRLWPMLVPAGLAVWLGGIALLRIELSWLTALLGALLVVYAGLSLSGLRANLQPTQEAWVGPLCGVANGVLTGMTGSFVVPGVMYLQSIGLARDALIQSMGILFTLSTLALAFSLQNNQLLSPELGIYSTIGLFPAIAGMLLGQRLRRRIPEAWFRRVIFGALLLLGIYILLQQM